MRRCWRKISRKIFIAIQVIIVLVPLFITMPGVGAAVLTSRSVTVLNPLPGATTVYQLRFNIATAGLVGSIYFQFCSNNPFFDTPCTPPTGLSLSGVSLSSQTGEVGFSIDASSNSSNILLTRSATAATPGTVQYSFSGAVNPTTINTSTYVRISTYATSNGSGPRTDQGAVVFSTNGNFNVGGFVPPFLTFCVAVTVSGDCSSNVGNFVDFGNLLPSQTSAATTQFAAATNDPTGYIIYSLGGTMTSGNNVIPALSIPTNSAPGNSQFGINLRSNLSPNIGKNPQGAGSGAPLANFNTPNLFMFSTGSAIAAAFQSTDFTVYTTSYIVNISASQPAGIYTTTLTYMAVAQF